MDIKWTMKEYFKWVYAHRFDNVYEMDKFLERYNLPKFAHEKYVL